MTRVLKLGWLEFSGFGSELQDVVLRLSDPWASGDGLKALQCFELLVLGWSSRWEQVWAFRMPESRRHRFEVLVSGFRDGK